MTHYEQRNMLEESVESLDTQLSEDDTIHVVDAGSTDGSFRVLEELDYNGKINLVLQDGVSCGRGRQIAFEESSAEIIVAHADLDTVFYPALKQLETTYRQIRSERGDGLLLVHGCFVTDRSTLDSVGGWNDLQVHEDKDLWARADGTVNLYQMPISIVQQHENFEWEWSMYRFKRLYQNYRDDIRLGIPKTALRKSLRRNQSIGSRPLHTALLSSAARRAKTMESYGMFETEYPDPEKFHLRELTYRSLVESEVVNRNCSRSRASFTIISQTEGIRVKRVIVEDQSILSRKYPKLFSIFLCLTTFVSIYAITRMKLR